MEGEVKGGCAPQGMELCVSAHPIPSRWAACGHTPPLTHSSPHQDPRPREWASASPGDRPMLILKKRLNQTGGRAQAEPRSGCDPASIELGTPDCDRVTRHTPWSIGGTGLCLVFGQ